MWLFPASTHCIFIFSAVLTIHPLFYSTYLNIVTWFFSLPVFWHSIFCSLHVFRFFPTHPTPRPPPCLFHLHPLHPCPLCSEQSEGVSECANGPEPVGTSAEQRSESTAPWGHPLITQTRSHPLIPLLSLSHHLLLLLILPPHLPCCLFLQPPTRICRPSS